MCAGSQHIVHGNLYPCLHRTTFFLEEDRNLHTQRQRAEPTDRTFKRDVIVPVPQLLEKHFVISNNISKSEVTPTQTVAK